MLEKIIRINIKIPFSSYLKSTMPIECLFVLPLVAPWFDKPKEDIKVSMEVGDKVSFKCGAKGFPLEVEWRMETHRKSSIQLFSRISKGGNYENQNPLRLRLVR